MAGTLTTTNVTVAGDFGSARLVTTWTASEVVLDVKDHGTHEITKFLHHRDTRRIIAKASCCDI